VPKLLTEGVLPVVEIAASALGILLILKRSTNVRKFWIVFLSLYCLVQVMEVVVGLESEGALFFLGSGMAWLVYWTIGKKPRELQLSAFWAKG
jgi:threonine/homoserine efflux transporter RhtA